MKAPDYSFAGQHRRLTFDGPVPETKRIYRFPGGDTIEICGVTKTVVSAHGNHMNYHGDTVTVVPCGWISLSYPAESDSPPVDLNWDTMRTS